VILDLLIAEEGSDTINSLVDSKNFTKPILEKWVEIDTALRIGGFTDRLALKLYLWNSTSKIPEGSQLNKLLKISKKLQIDKYPLIQLHYVDKEPTLDVVVPEYDMNDENSNKVLSHLISFACLLHGVKPDNVSYLIDKKQGTGIVTIPNTLNKLVDSLKVSAQHPLGIFAGEIFTFPSGYKGNLPGILASMRLISMKQEYLRKKKFPKNSLKSVVSYNELQLTFNIRSGLKSDETNNYTTRLVKAILASCVKPHNTRFPGGWIHSNRKINGIKTDFALLNSLGWTEKCPSQHKLLEVIFNTVDEDTQKDGNQIKVVKRQIINLTSDKRRFLHQEFRTAVALTLPRLLPNSDVSYDTQLKVDSLSVKSLSIIDNFSRDGRPEMVDALNESYNIKVSLKNPKSKTKEVHYKISRDRLLASSANIPLCDAEGTRYETFSKLPGKVQDYFRKSFNYPRKRALDSDAPTQEGAPLMDIDAGDASTQQRLKRVRTMTKGAAKDNVRRSGRNKAAGGKKA